MKAQTLRRTRGQTTIEFFFALCAFLVMLFAIADMLQIAHNWLGIQYATNRGIRQAKMLPTAMNPAAKATVIKTRVVDIAQSLGLALDLADVTVSITGGNINVETLRAVPISPLGGVLLALGGDHSGTYNLQIREAIRNESL